MEGVTKRAGGKISGGQELDMQDIDEYRVSPRRQQAIAYGECDGESMSTRNEFWATVI